MQFVTISLQSDEWENRMLSDQKVQIYFHKTWIQFQIKYTAIIAVLGIPVSLLYSGSFNMEKSQIHA